MRNSIRIIDLGNDRISNKVFKYNLFNTIFNNDEKDIYTLSFRKVFSKWRLRNTKSTIEKRYADILKPILNVVSVLFVSIISQLYFALYLPILCKKLVKTSFDEKLFFDEFLKLEVLGIHIGDCLCSSFLRSADSRGLIERSVAFYKHVLVFVIKFIFLYFSLRVERFKSYKNSYFFCTETTYMTEAIRRLLLKYRYQEIRYDPFEAKIVLLPYLKGYELRLRKDLLPNIYESVTNAQMLKAKDKLESIVYRNETYRYMKKSDVDLAIKLELKNEVLEQEEKIAVIFLHAVSDVQYIFGVDCFLDLHNWLMESIKLLKLHNVKTIIKMHPSYFSIEHSYPADERYLEKLGNIFDVDLFDLKKSELICSNDSYVFFLGYGVSVPEISSKINNFLCITHHGSVACEAAFLGHTVISSRASPYTNLDKFIYLYSTLEEYSNYIYEWVNSGSVAKSQVFYDSLYSYIYIHYFYKRYFYYIRYFPSIDGVQNSSLNSMEQLDQYLLNIDKEELRDIDIQMQQKIRDNISEQLR